MRRREFMAGLGAGASSALLPLAARGQVQPTILRVGYVSLVQRTAPTLRAFDQRLRELGYIEGQNLAMEYVNPTAQTDSIDESVKELLRRKVDIIVASGNEFTVKSALAATRTLPIVMVALDYDPLALGIVASLARPGGNLTGVVFQQIELSVKRLQITKEAFPDLRAATMFWDRVSAGQWQAMKSVAPILNFQVEGVELNERPYDYEQALAQVPQEHRGVLLVGTSPYFYADGPRLAEFATRHQVASIAGYREFVLAGGLASYGPNLIAPFRRAAEYVDRIAKGAKPADLPIEQPTKFEFVVNLKTAKAIGVTLPTSILLRADEVIE